MMSTQLTEGKFPKLQRTKLQDIKLNLLMDSCDHGDAEQYSKLNIAFHMYYFNCLNMCFSLDSNRKHGKTNFDLINETSGNIVLKDMELTCFLKKNLFIYSCESQRVEHN